MAEMIMIVSGSFREAQWYAKRHGIPPQYWDYVGAADELKGTSGKVAYIGTWYQRHDLAGIRREIEHNSGLKVLELDE